MNNISALLFGFIASVVTSQSLATTPRCLDLFAESGTLTKSFRIQTRNTSDIGNRLLDVKFESLAANGEKQLRLKTNDGQILDVMNISDLVKHYGEITAVRSSDYWYASNMLTNVAVSSRRNFSLRWHGDWLLKNEFFIIQTQGGVHFFEIQGPGQLVHYKSIRADANAEIDVVTVNQKIEAVKGVIGTTPVHAVEIMDSRGPRYYSGYYRDMIQRKDIGSVELRETIR